MRRPFRWFVLGLGTCVAIGCTTAGNDTENAPRLATALDTSFIPSGQAGLDRLQQDDTQRTCTKARGRALPPEIAAQIERANQATIRYPADGKLVGDWKNGERIAQEGRGKQFSDNADAPSGANCYACHRLSGTELAFGTLGPSLYRYGKLHGNGADAQRYTYGKIYNPEAFAACTSMPRFGHKGILTEQQIKDVTALLLDPASPVNQ